MKGSTVASASDGLESSRVGIGGLLSGLALGVLIMWVGGGIQFLFQPLVTSMTAGNDTTEIVADLLVMVLAAAIVLALTIWLSNGAFSLPPLSWEILAAATVVPLVYVLWWLPEAFRGWYAPVRTFAAALIAAGGATLYAWSRSRRAGS